MIQPPREIRTSRLLLRAPRPDDGAALYDAISVSMAEFYPWLSWTRHQSSAGQLDEISKLGEEEFNQGISFIWRVWDSKNVLVGSVDLHNLNETVPSCEIGYWLRSDRSGEGLATEFVLAAVRVAQEDLGMQRIEARCDVRNERAWRFAENLGFRFEGIARKDYRDASDALCDSKVYALTEPLETELALRGSAWESDDNA